MRLGGGGWGCWGGGEGERGREDGSRCSSFGLETACALRDEGAMALDIDE